MSGKKLQVLSHVLSNKNRTLVSSLIIPLFGRHDVDLPSCNINHNICLLPNPCFALQAGTGIWLHNVQLHILDSNTHLYADQCNNL